MSINISSALQPSAANLPIDARTRIASLSDVDQITLPYLGMIFYCEETGKLYKVTALKSKTTGPFVTQNAMIDTYEALPELSDLFSEMIIFEVSGLASSDLASLIIEFDSNPAFPENSETGETYDSADEDDNSLFLAWSVGLSTYPVAGINSAYTGVVFNVPATARAKKYYRYYWRSETGDSEGSVSSAKFGALRSVTHREALDLIGFGEE